MKVGIAGSRNLIVENIGSYLPPETDEIISGGAKGVDACAREYAMQNGIPYREFLPNYTRFGRAAPLKRNDAIITYADLVLVFWNGQSAGSRYVINRCKKANKPLRVFLFP